MELEPALLFAMVTDIAVPVSVAVATTTALSAAFFWFTRPGPTLHFLQNVGFFLLGMRVRQVKVEGINVSYAEKGSKKSDSGPSMLFVHGFSGSKDMWLSLVPLLPKGQHIVFVDLPGHGDTDLPGENFELNGQTIAKFLHQFVEAIQLNKEPFHLVGTSMGGYVVGLYAALYPHDLAYLTLVCPSILTPKSTEFTRNLEEGNTTSCVILPQNIQEAKAMFQKCVFRKDKIPSNNQIFKAILEIRRPRNDFFMELYRIFARTAKETTRELLQEAGRITCPTQIIWGRQDEIIDVTGAAIVKEALLNCQRMDIIDRCGHVTTFDRPKAVVKALLEFRGELSKRRRIPFL